MRKRLKRVGERNRAKMSTSSKKLVKNLRWTSIVLGISNVAVIAIGGSLFFCGHSQSCSRSQLLPFFLVMAAAGVRVMAMIRCAIEQQAAAIAVLGSSPDASVVSDNLSRVQRRSVRTRPYLGHACNAVSLSSDGWWRNHLLIVFLIMACFVAMLQCFASSDVLRWRSFYDMQDTAWKAHYHEVFDHGIREALCCLGRVKYLKNMEEDEVNSVAQLLGDLVTYRASGTGHLEFLAGLALLQMRNEYPQLDANSVDAPDDEIQEATSFHPFAEAAYTGPLLDVGRNPILFPCAWLRRQGVFTAWSRNRRPVLEGDNWWRGHAAAFLNYVNLPLESLRRGRVNQGKCQAAYFIVVLHDIRTVVIAVRGTETPEDLITDGLCRETSLTTEDLDGLIKQVPCFFLLHLFQLNLDLDKGCELVKKTIYDMAVIYRLERGGLYIDSTMRQTVLSSFPHHGYSGIVEAARELYHHIEGAYSGPSGVSAIESRGYLSSLLGAGCECDGYAVRIVGHSLGGSIAALLGIRLYGRFRDLHVYAYGPLPCVDSVIADACSSFITSVVHDSEFSSFLSVNSILRLRAAALTTLSQGSTTDTAMIAKLAQLFLYVSKYQNGKALKPLTAAAITGDATQSCTTDNVYRTHSKIFPEANTDLGNYAFLHDEFHAKENVKCLANDLLEDLTDIIVPDENPDDDPVSRFMEAVPSSVRRSPGDPPELFLPGLVIHLIRRQRGINIPLLKGWGAQESEPPYRAIIADRQNFKEILISPYMFLDHLPWRCQYALQRVWKSRKMEINGDGLQIV
uniref:Fungal lipase-like domain-containing protein n=1 Tax=Chenopodium quinoa TaxID=63459 RepID=A0A803NA71_CHEQI